LHYYIIKPLTTFTKKVENINWGNLEFKELESPRNDEVGHLYTKFSEMVLALKKAKTNIMQKTNELEFANKKLFLKSKELENVNEELKAANKKLEAAQLELKKWGQDLEKTVVERSKDLEKTQEQLHRSEKLAVLGKLAGSLSHELRNPLGAIKNAAFYLAMPKKERDIGAEQDNLRIIKNQVKIAEKILENTLDFARPREIELETVNMSEIIDGVISDMVIPENIIIVKEYKECVKMLCDPIHLRHVFTNIIANSIQAIKNEGKINVSVGKELDKAKVVIEDTGQGIEMEDLEKVFEPLYSKKSKGIGLGLYIVKSVIERLNGTIEIKSVFGQGTTVTILLPL
jgi:signal transduction histidine kinase